MSKALVIKNVDFSTNKIETDVFSDIVPCTGIVVTPSEISFSEIGDTQELTIIKTPANTTEAVQITSSDQSVCTVSNGVVTCVGYGTATITVTCGEASDTCSVELVSAEIEAVWQVGHQATYTSSGGGTMFIITNNADTYIFAAQDIKSGSQNSSEVFQTSHYIEALRVPSGCTTIHVVMNDYIGNAMQVTWYDSTSKPYPDFTACIAGISQQSGIVILQSGNDLTVPSGADSFILHVNTDTTHERYADTTSVAAAAGIKIYAL